MGWIAAHYSPQSKLADDPKLGHGQAGIFAARENALAPDTGYYSACWTLNLNSPIRAHIRDQIIGASQRTGVSGYLWDSVSNLGWWQVDYSNGTMRPQFDRMAQLWADFNNAGLSLWPEGIVAFSNQSCVAFPYPQHLMGENFSYSYRLGNGLMRLEEDGSVTDLTLEILKGSLPIDLYFQAFAFGTVPGGLFFHRVPREQWNAERVGQIKDLFAAYKKVRGLMHARTVLKEGRGVLWTGRGGEKLLFSFTPQKIEDGMVDVGTGQTPAGQMTLPNHIYGQRGL